MKQQFSLRLGFYNKEDPQAVSIYEKDIQILI